MCSVVASYTYICVSRLLSVPMLPAFIIYFVVVHSLLICRLDSEEVAPVQTLDTCPLALAKSNTHAVTWNKKEKSIRCGWMVNERNENGEHDERWTKHRQVKPTLPNLVLIFCIYFDVHFWMTTFIFYDVCTDVTWYACPIKNISTIHFFSFLLISFSDSNTQMYTTEILRLIFNLNDFKCSTIYRLHINRNAMLLCHIDGSQLIPFNLLYSSSACYLLNAEIPTRAIWNKRIKK